ncbi:peptidase M14 [Rhodobacteraceae bacterium RKSG542]|uniref:succinylglutamate desuccinylase/aspartoacylase domain-containing protein n=1 Tax=Pseudovibrio flavus TaxID=2529854 RepID=UPI0012BC5C68|nr:succinylglutamate desuccinylase/aspartoacylase family protein [Pseudovibrio flavus]MTI16754.1 peptidase M14 [Pseudovibrio flavus]
MQKHIEVISGDTIGVAYSFPYYKFEGSDAGAPSAYLQGAMHADELPGPAVLHFLMEHLRALDAEGKVLGNITVVPHCNPVGAAQFIAGKLEGRFHSGTRDNFNRSHPHLDRPDPSLLLEDDSAMSVDRKLKWRLAKLSLGHDIILDLHCDDESLNYVYIAEELWPQTQDLAALLKADAVLLWKGDADQPFESAALSPYLSEGQEAKLQERVVVSTLELRGARDVREEMAREDAQNLLNFLIARGVVAGEKPAPKAFEGPAVPLPNIEMMNAPASGIILYAVSPGDVVKEGDLLATLITEPGNSDSAIEVRAPQAGLILTRRSHRFTRSGDALLKLLGSQRSKNALEGILES